MTTGASISLRLAEADVQVGNYAYVQIRYAAWFDSQASGGKEAAAARERLDELCWLTPIIEDADHFAEVLAPIPTHFRAVRPDELAAIKIAARFAVERARDELLQWASDVYGGAPAVFVE